MTIHDVDRHISNWRSRGFSNVASTAIHWALAIAVLAVIPGCLNLEPRGNPTEYYVLGDAWTEPVDVAPGLSVGLRQLELAAYLETPRMVVRQGTHQVRFSEYHRWAEDLNHGINRALAGYLVARPDVRRVDVVPWPRRVTHDYAVQVHVLRFEGVAVDAATNGDRTSPEGTVHLLATWEITEPGSADVLASGTTDYVEQGWTVTDYDQMASLLDAGLQVLADAVADAIATLPAP